MSELSDTTIITTFSLPIWAEWIKALGLPIAGVFGLFFAYRNSTIAEKKRKQDLFDKRLEFYRRFIEARKIKGEPDRDDPEYLPKLGRALLHASNEIRGLSEEGEFLFGQDIKEHLEQVANWLSDGEKKLRSGQRPSEALKPIEFMKKPFDKYMRLG